MDSVHGVCMAARSSSVEALAVYGSWTMEMLGFII